MPLGIKQESTNYDVAASELSYPLQLPDILLKDQTLSFSTDFRRVLTVI